MSGMIVALFVWIALCVIALLLNEYFLGLRNNFVYEESLDS